MRQRPVIDVSALPTTAFGQRDPLFWGVLSIMSIEGTMFALMAASYFYLRGTARLWPPAGTFHPGLGLTTANLLIMLVSIVPMALAAKAAKREDLPAIRLWLIVATVFCVASLVLRWVVLQHLTFRWDSHAYGSLIWTTAGLHTIHLLTGTCENILFIVLLTKGPVEDKHMDDLWLNSLYWYFVVACWVPFYCIFFLDPGLLATLH
jgi:cytochrome c oxidase subunit I+III